MADRPTKLIVDCSTGERTVLELTDEEIAEREVRRVEAEAELLAEQEAATARLAAKESAKTKLEALGLTETEIAAIVGN
jgi:hypothetical protein